MKRRFVKLIWAIVAQKLWINRTDVETTWKAVTELPIEVQGIAIAGDGKTEQVEKSRGCGSDVEVGVEVEDV